MQFLKDRVIYFIGTGARKVSLMPKAIQEFTSDGARIYTMFSDMGKELAQLPDFDIAGNSSVFGFSREGEALPLEDLVLVAPCTFNTLNKIALGIADNYPLTIIASAIGSKRPVKIAPAMNQSLWNHPVTQESISRLHSWGIHIIYPEITSEKVTMAPIEKIVDCVYHSLVGARYEDDWVEPDKRFRRLVEENYSEFRKVGEEMGDLTLTTGSGGCLSVRTPKGILVSSSGSQIGSLSLEEISLIICKKNGKLVWQGTKKPSSESPLFYELYGMKKNIGAVIHGHCPRITYSDKMQKYVTQEYVRYGLFGQGEKMVKKLEDQKGFVILKMHGELAIGENLRDSLNRLKEKLEIAHEK